MSISVFPSDMHNDISYARQHRGEIAPQTALTYGNNELGRAIEGSIDTSNVTYELSNASNLQKLDNFVVTIVTGGR